MNVAYRSSRHRDRVLSRLPAGLSRLRAWWPSEAFYAIRLGLTSIAAIYLSLLLQLQTPEWAGWTVLSVSLATRASSLQKSLWRAIGSIGGGMASIMLVACFSQSVLAFDIALALWLGLTAAAATVERGQRSYGFALLGFTVPIVTLGNVDHPELVFDSAIDRCSTLLLGIACAHVSSVLVDRGVRTARVTLAGTLDAAASACDGWMRSVTDGKAAGAPPIDAVLALDVAIADAFTEQPSLQTGGRAVAQTPIRLLHMLTAGLVLQHLGPWPVCPQALLTTGPGTPRWRLQQVRVVGRLLRSGRRIGTRHAGPQPLGTDRDGRQAVRNAVRAAIAVSLTSGFWYASEWPSGGDAVTWTALVSLLFAARADAAAAARNFMTGAALAAALGTTLHYSVLTANGTFALLAAVLLPVLMLAALARSDRRAATGSGYALVILTIIAPSNVMHYDLAATLNSVAADLLGMGVAVAAFTALPPPASPATRRWRARRRLAMGVRAVACRPRFLLPARDRWLGRMFDRLSQLGPEPADVIEGGQALLLIGSLLLALRRHDDRLGREIGRTVWTGGPEAGDTVARIVGLLDPGTLQRERIAALAALLRAAGLRDWPGLATGTPA